jgi:putative CocE/NonD family hydrolase
MSRRSLPVLLLLALLAACAPRPREFERRILSIPMRDGVRLFAVALVPVRPVGPLGIILIRTPFSAAREFPADAPPTQIRELAKDGYIFVDEDIRGRYGSGGAFVTMRPLHDPHDSSGTDESTDAWDTIDWLVKNLPGNNGKVGVLGISYRGWLAAMAGIHPHPALKAISPQAPMADLWMGDDFFHQGAFRETQGAAYAAFIERGKGFAVPDSDQYDFYLRHQPLGALARVTGVDSTPSWTGFRAHPAYDDYWKARALPPLLTRVAVPTLWVGGWWDQEDLYGPQAAYRAAESRDSGGIDHIVLGPWFHGQWGNASGDSIGPIPLGSATADSFRAGIERAWFDWYLHGRGDGKFPEAWAFETGENAWHALDAWPPRKTTARDLYLLPGGRLGFAPAGRGAGEYDRYLSDPAHPVPYVPRPDDGDGWPTWMVKDQRFLHDRPDVRMWVSDPLPADLTIAGDVTAHLFASTTGTDADWVVKLIDLYPDSAAAPSPLAGYELMVAGDILRGRYWQGFGRATPIPAGQVTPFTVDLHQQFYRFRKGHRLMVQVQSSWFPLYDRNPQTFVPNIFEAGPGDFRSAEMRIWHTREYPSRVSVQEW